VLRHGWNAAAYQLLNPGIAHWLAPGGEAVVGYAEAGRGPLARRGRMWIAAGGPVCAAASVEAVADAFEAEASRHRALVCWFGADARLRGVRAGRRGYSEMTLGAQPVWDPSRWEAVVRSKASLRAQLNRARNKGVAVRRWPSAQAREHPALRRLLRDWLGRRGLPTLHFLVEPDTLGALQDRLVLVAEQEGVPVGFSVLSPIPARQGWLVEQIVRGSTAPNGTAALLVGAAMRTAAEAGSRFVTLGLSPLSSHAPTEAGDPLWLRALLGWMRAHGRRFYNFRGLDAFKSKFVPDRWDPITAIATMPKPSAGTLYAITDAFAGPRTPARLLAGALVKAAKAEVAAGRRWLSGPGTRT